MSVNQSIFDGLPPNWVKAKLGDVASLEYGKALPARDREESGSVPVYGSSGLVGRHSSALTKEACLVVGRKGSVGSVHLAAEPCWPIDTTYFVVPPSEMDLDFLFHLFSSLNLGRLDRSTAIPGLNRDDAYDADILLPPLPEQRRIVAKLEELFTRLDAGVEALERVQALLERYRQAVLRDAFTGRLTAAWREAHRDELEPASVLLERVRRQRGEAAPKKGRRTLTHEWPPVNSCELPELPAGWQWCRLAEIGLVASGQTPRGVNDCATAGEIPYYKVGDMNTAGADRLMRESRIMLTERQVEVLGLTVHDAGTVIFPKRGGAIATNKKRVLTRPSAYDLNTMGVHPVIPVRYFYYWMESIDLATLADGSNVPQITHKDIEPLPFPLAPWQEMTEIGERLDVHWAAMDSVLHSLEQVSSEASMLRQNILRRAFEGKLVPQGPNDEPAVKLLERIRAERRAQGRLL